MTVDPSRSAHPAQPGSWNQYAYVQGDPANYVDPTGETRISGEGGVPHWPIPFVIFGLGKIFGAIFGGGGDPVIGAWKNHPSTMVGAWDTRIAAAEESGGEQELRYINSLKVIEDCYEKNRLGMPIRRITYQAIDQHGVAFARGEYSVAESHNVVRGQLDAKGVWGPREQNANGSFDDFVGLRAPWTAEIITYQQFTATMLNSAGYKPGVPNPVVVWYPGYGNGDYFGTMGHWITKDGDRMNGRWGAPGGRYDCARPRYGVL
jgi:hypothetical protein